MNAQKASSGFILALLCVAIRFPEAAAGGERAPTAAPQPESPGIMSDPPPMEVLIQAAVIFAMGVAIVASNAVIIATFMNYRGTE